MKILRKALELSITTWQSLSIKAAIEKPIVLFN